MANQNGKAFYVTLPYDFISFADKNHFPYKGENVPGHDSKNGLCGCLSYAITPCSDLALEVRTKRGGDYFVGGSQIRGRIRSNLEILSAAYPEFISHTPMLYRDFTGASKASKNSYKKRMGLSNGIERAVQAGFLKKVGNEFYVIPAQQFGDKNFLSIKEHRLVEMRLSRAGESFSTIFKWEDKDKREFDVLQNRIADMTKQIKSQRENYKDKLKDETEKFINIQEQISNVFHKYNFSDSNTNTKLKSILNKLKREPAYHYKPDLARITKDLWKDLQEKLPSDNGELIELYRSTVERWQLKAELHIKYRLLRKNKDFLPYQRNAYYRADGQGIEKIAFSASPETPGKAYLFNSTNAGSKQSHYFVREPESEHEEYPVPPSVIDGYRQYLKKFRIIDGKESSREEKKKFYDIFDSYEELQRKSKGADGIIVFFRCSQNEETGIEEVAYLGRTPYLKIPYKYQLKRLLGKKEKDRVDYAGALFGFIPDEGRGDDETRMAYKSRLRFSPVDISGQPDIDCKEFLLLTPYASSSAMYLQQGDKSGLQTYEEDKQPCLNGYKYYHILKEPLEVSKEGKPQNILSGKKIIKKGSIECLTGKIYFHNLSKAELGLLLLSIDLKQLLKSEKYKEIASEYQAKLEQSYDLLGGAKPYGYGKVNIEIKSLELEKKGNDFSSLVLEPMQTVEKWHQYIDDFIGDMGGQQYFDQVHFDQYLQSKLEIDDPGARPGHGQGEKNNPKHHNWNDTSAFGKGYDKKWRLQKNFFLAQGQKKVSEEKS